MDRWYYSYYDQVLGPKSREEMLELNRKGIVEEETLIKKEEQEEWVAFENSELGHELAATTETVDPGFSGQVRGAFLNATAKVNQMVGEKGNIDLNMRDVFSDVFKKHSKEEGELLFISGTSVTTPEESEISYSWPKPWLFSRIFLASVLIYILLYVCVTTFQNANAIPGMIVIGAFAVPFSLLVFFWETNAPRNISIFEVIRMFFVGGVASIAATLFIFSFFPVFQLDFSGAIAVSITEELGKLAIIAYFINKLQVKYILNGLLIGAAIGAGFAAFESAGYAFNIGLVLGGEAMIANIMDRALLAVGGHVVWAAITGAALTLVKGNAPLSREHLLHPTFLKLFLVPVILHAVWNMPLPLLHTFYAIFLVLIVIAWVFIFTLMNAGLKQIPRLNTSYEDHEKQLRSRRYSK
ncbi:PrsW family glutamic-type intramembrane protease [Alteribacillus sp. HJP-4]|uniref:PrsW family glutamic-type intramembrane protease n=1 Tax=Alteribacillus sp. HJP-4 TaxID=2775394 RepID=UPI0035CD0A89